MRTIFALLFSLMLITPAVAQQQRDPSQRIITESGEYRPEEHFRHFDITNPVTVLGLDGVNAAVTNGVGLFACAVGNLFIAAGAASYGENRELLLHEAWEVVAACVLPGFGLAFIHRLFWDHPEWDVIVMDETIYPRYDYEHQMKMIMH